ncbi:hypothetical protein L9F63_021169 [Diploptera punctata]|uniref:Uncharacterized protein n=1 Tax=Diploptera punctata TaxID=6984 RepID=A0AAD7ZQ02_DIPPU|nr:hypothetical protein L9F63_021169 [Diploptera punctata]
MELVFRAENLPPLGFHSYYISKSNHIYRSKQFKASNDRDIIMGSSKYRVILDGKTGKLKSMRLDGVEFPVGQDFYYYKGCEGNNSEAIYRASGAYIFRPNGTEPIKINSSPKTVTYKGDLVDEIHVQFSDWVSQVWRFYKKDIYSVELEWLVGPIPIKDNIGKEIINRYESELKSKSLFYTDTNGRETLERKRNFRPTWELQPHEPVAGNYYPITSKIAIRDTEKNVEFAILTDRSQGGSSLKDGQMELMRMITRGRPAKRWIDKPLNETAYGKGLVAIGKHWLTGGTLGSNGTAAVVEHDLIQEIALSPWLFFTPAENITFETWSKKYKMEYTGLTTELPKNIDILTLEPWTGRKFLLRLEHKYEKNENTVYSKPVIVKLRNLFRPFTIMSARETTLGGNQWLNETHRLQWKAESNEIDLESESEEFQEELYSAFISEEVDNDPLIITITPMQIRTFIIEIKASDLSNSFYDKDFLMEE